MEPDRELPCKLERGECAGMVVPVRVSRLIAGEAELMEEVAHLALHGALGLQALQEIGEGLFR